MGTPNPDDMPLGNPDPTSEVGLGLAQESEGVGEPWRAMLELQNHNMTQLIEAIKTHSAPSTVITLPDFDPDLPDSDAQSWSTTVDICLSEKPLQGGTLIIALTKALKGSANVWLSQVSYAGMTWTDFKSLFLSRYAVSETVAATLINLHSSQPKEGESLAAYASRQVTSLTSKWNSLSVSLFGAPSRVIADQGRCFASKNFKEFCDSHNIGLHLIATGACRANGQVERIMKTLKSMLTAVETSERSWQDAIEDVQIALNCTVNRVTKSSPLDLLIGRVARPLGLMTIDNEEIEVNLSRVREQAALGITKSAEYDKARYDKTKAILKKFQVGDFVLIANEERNQTKLDPKFKGPYRILELLDGDRYLLKALNTNRIYKYAHDRVRKMPECPVTVSDDINTDTDDDSSAADIS